LHSHQIPSLEPTRLVWDLDVNFAKTHCVYVVGPKGLSWFP
jgi:hypothetical protein